MKIIGIVLSIFGLVLLALGFTMRSKQNAFTHMEQEVIEGNRGTTTAVGAATGAVAGGVLGASIGGVGVALCGTGVGIPAGAVMLGLAAILGGGGAAVGAAVGTPDKTVSTPVVEMVNAYSPMEYGIVLGIGIVLLVAGFILVLKSYAPVRNDLPIVRG